MADKMSFQQKLADIMQTARENGMCMTAEEAERFFAAALAAGVH